MKVTLFSKKFPGFSLSEKKFSGVVEFKVLEMCTLKKRG